MPTDDASLISEILWDIDANPDCSKEYLTKFKLDGYHRHPYSEHHMEG